MPAFEFRKIIDTSLLQDLPDSFYQATGVTTAVHDTRGNLVTRIPERNFSSFCHNMFFNREGHARCVLSNGEGAMRSVEKNGPHVHKCHAGLIDVFAPIMYNDTHVGTVCCGQLMFEKPSSRKKDEVREKLSGLPEEFIEKQMSALDDVTIVSKPRVEGLARLLGSIANEIVRLIIAHEQEKATSKEKSRLLDEMTARARLEEEVKNAQIRLKESELRLLEAQINPHFLYNTLDSIQWLAVKHGRKEIQDMICSLSSLMRYSLGRGNHVIRVADELEQILNYLRIQKVRYGDKLHYTINLESEVRDCLIPKLVLQPLVENAIKHGIDPSSEPGTVSIAGWLAEDGSAILEVENDGVPVSEDQIRSIRENLQRGSDEQGPLAERRTGYGLSNVHERLKINYGNDHGVEVRSTPQRGICVRMVVPPSMRTALNGSEIHYGTESTHC
jgi:ligand-binding sensor protein